MDTEDEYKSIHQGFKKILQTNSRLYVIYPIEQDFIEKNYDYDLIMNLYNGSIKCGLYNIKNG